VFSVFHSSVWTTCNLACQNVPAPEGWGWIEDNEHSLVPVWMTIPEVAKACRELISNVDANPAGAALFANLDCPDVIELQKKLVLLFASRK